MFHGQGYLDIAALLLGVQCCGVPAFHLASQQIQQVRPRTWRLTHGLVVVDRYCDHLFAVVEPPERDPDAAPVTSDGIELVPKARLMHQSCSVDSQSNAGSYLPILRCLFVDIDVNGYTGSRAMMVDGEGREESPDASPYYRDADRL